MAYYGDGGSTPGSPYMNTSAGMADSPGPHDPLTPGETAGIVCATVMLAALLGVAFYMRYRRGKRDPPKPGNGDYGTDKPDDPRDWSPEAQNSTLMNVIKFKPDTPGRTSGSTLQDHSAANVGHVDGEGINAQGQARKKTWAPWSHPTTKQVLASQVHLAGMV